MAGVITVDIWHGTALFGVLLLAGLRAIPAELLDAARVDAANAVQLWDLDPLVLLPRGAEGAVGPSPHRRAGGIQALWRVLLPLSGPVQVAVGLFAVAVVFSDFLYAFALVSRSGNMTLMAGVGSTSVDIDDHGLFFAAILLGMAPVALFCAFSAGG